MEGETSGVTRVLMAVAVVAVVVAGVNLALMFGVQGTGRASSTELGNVTLQIQQVILLNFSNNLVNWSSGYVNSSVASPCFGNYAILDTNNTANPVSLQCSGGYPTSGWQPVNRGLIISTAGTTLPIAINLSSNQNSVTFLDGGSAVGSAFRWKVSEFNVNDLAEPSTCDGTLAPATYTDIVASQQVRICNQTQYLPDRDELRIDFQLNVSVSAPAQAAYRTAVITATGWLP